MASGALRAAVFVRNSGRRHCNTLAAVGAAAHRGVAVPGVCATEAAAVTSLWRSAAFPAVLQVSVCEGVLCALHARVVTVLFECVLVAVHAAAFPQLRGVRK